MTIEPTTLEYARRGRLAWVSRHKRFLLSLAVLFVIGTALYHFRERLKHRALWLYWSHRCATFKMPPNTVLTAEDPSASRRLASNPDYLRRTFWSAVARYYEPVCVQRLKQVDPRLNLIEEQSPIAFVGEMLRPDGQSRLVILRGGELNGCNLLYEMRLLVLPEPGLFDPFPPAPMMVGRAYSGPYVKAEITAASLDPNDATHLVITLTAASISGTIDAYLQDDDSLELTLKKNPELEKNHIHLGPKARKSGITAASPFGNQFAPFR